MKKLVDTNTFLRIKNKKLEENEIIYRKCLNFKSSQEVHNKEKQLVKILLSENGQATLIIKVASVL